jgi:hypothetical protein
MQGDSFSARGLFCFGTQSILVSGEASGLLNLFGEGIFCALVSGRITLLFFGARSPAEFLVLWSGIWPGGSFDRLFTTD